MIKKMVLLVLGCFALTSCSNALTVEEADKEAYEFCQELDNVDDALVGKWAKAYLKSFTYPDAVRDEEWDMLYWVSEQDYFDFIIDLPDTFDASEEDVETFKQYVTSTWEYNQALERYNEQLGLDSESTEVAPEGIGGDMQLPPEPAIEDEVEGGVDAE